MNTYDNPRIVAILLAFFTIYVTSLKAQCLFPKFAQSPKINGKLDRWITQRQYYGASSRYWRRQTTVIGKINVLIFYTNERHCTDDIPACYKSYHSHNRTCVKDLGKNRFLVEHAAPGRLRQFMCIQLLERGPNIIQIRESYKRNDMHDSLCNKQKLFKNNWPWLAERQRKWSYCPNMGGYVFHTFNFATQMGICPGVWRQSRIEVECLKGEGLQFTFPNAGCNPFNPLPLQRLFCYGSWEEDEYTFLVVYEEGQFPRFTMRYPKSLAGDFTVYLYRDVMASSMDDGRPPQVNNIQYYKLRMKRGSSSVCADDSEQCLEFAKSGYCTSRPPYEYATYCKASCRLCASGQIGQPECKFPKPYHNTWMLYERDRTEEVKIEAQFAEFSELGKFSCKSKDFSRHRYKLMSTFRNGCLPRYTCIEFNKAHHNILQYRMSEGRKSDLSFHKLCRFRNDPIPLDDGIRSKHMKNLILKKGLRRSLCHINGLIPFNASYPNSVGSRYCPGYISDFNPFKCEKGSQLSVQVKDCHVPNIIKHETLTCVARIVPEIPHGDIFLFTEEEDDKHRVSCWVISKSEGRRYSWDGRIIYRMSTSQCNSVTAVEIGYSKTAKTTYLMHDDQIIHRPVCIEATPSPTRPPRVRPSQSGGSGKTLLNKQPGRRGPRPAGSTSNIAGLHSQLHLIITLTILWIHFAKFFAL